MSFNIFGSNGGNSLSGVLSSSRIVRRLLKQPFAISTRCFACAVTRIITSFESDRNVSGIDMSIALDAEIKRGHCEPDDHWYLANLSSNRLSKFVHFFFADLSVGVNYETLRVIEELHETGGICTAARLLNVV